MPPGTACEKGRERFDGWNYEVGRETYFTKANCVEPEYCLAGAGAEPGGREEDMFADFSRGYALARVAESTRRAYAAGWMLWVSWRMCQRKGCWLCPEMGVREVVEEVAQFMAFCCAAKNN